MHQFEQHQSIINSQQQQQQHQQQLQTTEARSTSQHRLSTYTIRDPSQRPQFVKQLQNSTFNQGEVALIQCIAVSTQDADVKWFRNSNLIQASDNYVMDYDYKNGLCSLSIGSAAPEDSGQYTCVVSNFAGSESSTAFVTIKGNLT